MMSAPADSDLLEAESWVCTNRLAGDVSWMDGKFNGWLEGNAVVTPDGRLVDILRVDSPEGGVAAMLQLAASTPGLSTSNECAYPRLDADILDEPLECFDGMLAVPQGPGLGVEVDRARIEQVQVTR